MNSSIKRKYWSFLALLPLMFFLGILAVEISQMFLIPVLGLLFIAGFGLMSLKCAKCGEPLLYREKRILGTVMVVWGWRLPKKCVKCNEPI